MATYTYLIDRLKPLIFRDNKLYLDTAQEFPSAEDAEAWAQAEVERLSAPAPAPAEPRPVLTKEEFRARFRFSERVAIYEEAKTDTGVQVILDDLMAKDSGVDLGDPAVEASLDYLVSKGLLSEERRGEILG